MPTEPIEERFEKEMRGCEDLIHKVCRVYSSDPHDRQDLFQEILLQLWKGYGTFRGEAKISTWVYRIAINTSLTHQRKNRSVVVLGEDMIDVKLPVNTEAYEEHYAEMYRAITHLNETEKAIVMLFLEDKSYEEMESILGISQGALRVKMHRIKEKLRNITKHL